MDVDVLRCGGGRVNREQRFEAIAVAQAADLTPLADVVLADTEVAVIRGPTVGMVMLQARESVEGIRFNVGEVLVTEALVAIGAHHGYALVQGMAHELALAGAICDAAVEADHPVSARILDALRTAETRAGATAQAAWARVAGTRVAFDEM
jgi:alpha-D-ribose 1-methylphosphonate 5-triphosphate synthase subunit PhnG